MGVEIPGDSLWDFDRPGRYAFEEGSGHGIQILCHMDMSMRWSWCSGMSLPVHTVGATQVILNLRHSFLAVFVFAIKVVVMVLTPRPDSAW